MRKVLTTMALMAFLCNGCAMFGSGDDGSTTAQAETVAEEGVSASTSSSPTKSAAKKGVKKSEAQIKQELDQKGKKLVAQSARTIMPNQANKQVKHVGKEWIASYIHVDPNHVVTELRPGANGYVGFIRYTEDFMECRGATKQAALSAPCTRVRTRNMKELIRYDGNQWLD